MRLRVLVVGAGVIGAAAAYYLSCQGARVTVVDSGDVGGGTSSRSDGNVLAIDKEPGYDAQLALMSQDLLAQLAPLLGPMEYRRPGSYLVCAGLNEVEPAQSWVDRQCAAGLDFRFLDAAAVRRELPDMAPDIPAGVYCASDSTLNPLLYVQRLVEAARALGADIQGHRRVEAVEVDRGRATGVLLTDGDRLSCDRLVVAAGVWTPALLEPLDVSVPIRPRKGQLVVSSVGPRFGAVKVMEFGYLMSKFGQAREAPVEAERCGAALVYEPTASGNFLLGSSREFVGFDTTPSPAVTAAIIRRALRFYPGMRSAVMIRSYAGLRPWTPDHFPVVSAIDPVEGLYVAAGHEGDGIGLAAVTGRLLADLVLEQAPIVDPSPLRWDRPGLLGHEAS